MYYVYAFEGESDLGANWIKLPATTDKIKQFLSENDLTEANVQHTINLHFIGVEPRGIKYIDTSLAPYNLTEVNLLVALQEQIINNNPNKREVGDYTTIIDALGKLAHFRNIFDLCNLTITIPQVDFFCMHHGFHCGEQNLDPWIELGRYLYESSSSLYMADAALDEPRQYMLLAAEALNTGGWSLVQSNLAVDMKTLKQKSCLTEQELYEIAGLKECPTELLAKI